MRTLALPHSSNLRPLLYARGTVPFPCHTGPTPIDSGSPSDSLRIHAKDTFLGGAATKVCHCASEFRPRSHQPSTESLSPTSPRDKNTDMGVNGSRRCKNKRLTSTLTNIYYRLQPHDCHLHHRQGQRCSCHSHSTVHGHSHSLQHQCYRSSLVTLVDLYQGALASKMCLQYCSHSTRALWQVWPR